MAWRGCLELLRGCGEGTRGGAAEGLVTLRSRVVLAASVGICGARCIGSGYAECSLGLTSPVSSAQSAERSCIRFLAAAWLRLAPTAPYVLTQYLITK